MHELVVKDYGKVRSLFTGIPFDLHMGGILAGNSPARIWVDNAANPTTGYIWDKAHCHYVGGYTGDAEVLATLQQLIFHDVAAQAIAGGFAIFKVFYTSAEWEKWLEDVLENTRCERRERLFYRIQQLGINDWRDRVPAEVRIEAISTGVLQDAELTNVSKLTSEIGSCWNSVERFVENGFGFCAIVKDTIACWCTAEYVHNKECGCGIETIAEYQNKGLATLTAAVFADYCLANALTAYWDVWAKNLASIMVAQKVGFTRIADYRVINGVFEQGS